MPTSSGMMLPTKNGCQRSAGTAGLPYRRDRRIYYRPNEKEAVIRARAALFIVVGKASHKELAENFVRSIRVVERFARRHEAPFIAKVYRPPGSGAPGLQPGPGRVALWYPDGG